MAGAKSAEPPKEAGEKGADAPKEKRPKGVAAPLRPALDRLRKIGGAAKGPLVRLGKRLAKHPLCNLGLHKWQLKGWGRCARKRCEVYRSFGKVAGVKE
ncbi:MAG: hypothetical protein QXO51_03845 [Halobacteria archaeon]